MGISTTHKLQTYITSELKDSMLYRELAELANNDENKTLLLEIARDEQNHADEFNLIYKMLTGKKYMPNIALPKLDCSFNKKIMEKIADESNDMRNYNKEYMSENKNSTLKNLFYRAAVDENAHALKLLYLLNN